MRLLLTGFGPFLSIGENPSQVLASTCGCPYAPLEVAYRGVDAFIEGLDPDSFDALMLLGVAASAPRFRIETTARNRIGATPDVRGEVYGPGVIDPKGPPLLAATLWRHPELLQPGDEWEPSADAGDYLCNYVFYQALSRYPDRPVGFLHVPSFETAPLEQAQQTLARILRLVEGQA